MAETTLSDLITEVADAFGAYRSGTADSGTTTTVVDEAALYEADDYWIGHYVYITEDAGGASAAPEGEERPITDYSQSDAELTVSPAFSAAVDADDTFEILPLRRDTIKRAINRAIEHADAWRVQETDSTTVTIASDDYDYSLPSDLVQLSQVWTRDDTDEGWVEVSPNQWRVSGTPGSQVLYFDTLADLGDGDTIRLEYMAYPSTLDDDTDTLDMGEPGERSLVDFIVNYALYWLFSNAAARAPTAETFRPYLTLADYRSERAQQIKERTGRQRPPGRVHGPYPPRSIG